MKSCVVMGGPDVGCQMTDVRCQMTDDRVQRTEFSSSVLWPPSSVLRLEIRACLNKSGAAAALEQSALAGSPGCVTCHADVIRRMGGAGRESSNRRRTAREVEPKGAGRHRDGRCRAHLYRQRDEDD